MGLRKDFVGLTEVVHLFFTVRPNLLRTSFRIHGCIAAIVPHSALPWWSEAFPKKKFEFRYAISMLTG